jgi:glycosyltransferase involved in cell wall biosynthesis
MKVLMVVSWYSPKDAPVMTAGVFHYEQSMALKPYCDMALYYPYDTDLVENFSKSEEKGLLTYRRKKKPLRIPKVSAFLHQLRIFSDLHRICKEFKPDVLHAHCSIPAGQIVALFGKKYGYPVVITEHNPMEQLPLDRPSVRKKIDYAYGHSSANVCVSINSMERLKEAFPAHNFQVIYNGIINPDSLPKENQTYAVPGKINCCIVAAFYSQDIKGYQYLIPAMKQLKEQGVPIVLHICGGGDWFAHYVSMAKDLDVEDVCIFHGSCSREKVYSIVSQMDFNISASIFECSGVSVEEALLLGKPMLVTRSGGANSLVNDDVAIVVDRGSTQALVDGIHAMIKRLPDFNAAVIKDYAWHNFEIDQVSQQYECLYRSVMEKKHE